MVDRRTFLATMGTLTASTVAGCNGDSGATTPTKTPTATPTETPPGNRITMTGTNAAGLLYFNPVGLYVEPGETVTWKGENGQHSTHAFHPDTGSERRIPDGAEPWSSSVISYGTFEHTFEVEGTYDYYCGVHYNHSMVGRIVVGSPGGPADGQRTAYGPVPAADAIVERGKISYFDFSDEG